MLFGDKTTAWFDIWSIQHIMSLMWVIVRFEQGLRPRVSPRPAGLLGLLVALCLGFAFEPIERLAELGYAGSAVAQWFAGEEYWANRWIADTIVCGVAAYLLSRNRPWLVYAARQYSVSWMLLHVLLAPHSMYLQRPEVWENPLTWITVFGFCLLCGVTMLDMRRGFLQNYAPGAMYVVGTGFRRHPFDEAENGEVFP